MDDKFYVGRVTVGKRPTKHGYYAYYRDSAGKQHNKSLRTNNKKEAKDRAQRIADTIEAGTDLRVERVRENRGVTVSDAIPTVIKLVKWDGRYRDECIKILHQFEEQYGDQSMAFITQADINEYLVAVLQRTSRATHNRHKSTLRGFFQAAHSKDLVAEDPTKNVGHLEEPENVPDALTEEQFDRVLNALPEHAQIIMQILHDTGMRAGELHSLTWRNIRSDKRMIVVEDSKNNQFRLIPMTDAVYALFERLRKDGHHPLKRNGSRVPFKRQWPDDSDPDAVAIP
ncbi:MAG: integrase, partial [Candidatus Latescibacterota bacterium]